MNGLNASWARLTLVLLAGLLLAGCGKAESSDDESSDDVQARASVSDFPRVSHRSLEEFVAGMEQGPELAPSVTLLTTGRNRFGFGLFDDNRRQIGDLQVAIYYARGVDETVRGPFPAGFAKINVKPAYQSKTSAQDPDAASSIYVSEINFKNPGNFLAIAVTRLGGTLVATSPAQISVARKLDVPGPGDQAIRVHTPTAKDVGGRLEKIDTRVPPSGMHKVDLADALDEGHSALLLFATPGLCQSRVCGPVADVAEQLRSEYGDRVDFIHSEVYRDNDLNKGPNRQMKAWQLTTEPVAFAIDPQGRIVDRLEGAFTVAELEAAIKKTLE